MTRDHEWELQDLYEQVRLRLRASASRFVGWDDAEDVVQDAFVKALASPGAFRREASMTTWMTRIVLNAAIDETRKRKRRPRCVSAPDLAQLPYAVTPQYCGIELKAAFAACSHDDREILVLAGLLGFSYKETARRLGVPVGTAKSRLCTARSRLRRTM